MGLLKGKAKEKSFLLGDLSREWFSVADPSIGDWFSDGRIKNMLDENRGKFFCIAAGNQYGSLNFTGPPGATTKIYFPFCFWVRRQGFKTEIFDESFEVTPMHSAYYQLTSKQKEDLEAKIKAGIASAAQSVSDFELLSHDERKYREFLRYYGYRTKRESIKKKPETEPDDFDELVLDPENIEEKEKFEKEIEKHRDYHALKAFFIDQVDANTGNDALRQIVQRWPTIITDFMKITDDHLDLEKIRKDLKISKAEAVVLLTKNKLFQEWKRMFFPEVKNRYERIKQLLKSRKKSVEEYREWVKPYIAKHRLIKEALSSSGGRMSRVSNFALIAGQAGSSSLTTLFCWKPFQVQEYYVSPGEISTYTPANAYDDWTKENLIWDEDHGLAATYPWITEKWVDSQVDAIFGKTEHARQGDPWMWEKRNYYTLIIIEFMKNNLRFPDGLEIEDGIFNLNAILMSSNAMLAKLLELKAKQFELEKYVDEMLGIKSDFLKGEKWKPKKNWLDFNLKLPINIPSKFSRFGPYENSLNDRVTKGYLTPMARYVYVPLASKLLDLAGWGKA